MNEINGHPERIIPDEAPPGIVALHLKRYDFARTYVSGKTVLDIACGMGYGSSFLSLYAKEVTGVDIDQEAITYAKQRYGGPSNLSFVQADATQLEIEDAAFDVICSFETIEHVPNAESYLKEMRRVLIPGGIYIVSTPRAADSTTRPQNPHHFQEWEPRDFLAMLKNHFDSVELFSQIRKETFLSKSLKNLDFLKLRARLRSLNLSRHVASIAGVRTMADLHMDDIVIELGLHKKATEVIGVCQKAPI